jgi:8-oxo-dGTP pyrophosphatase MutT (NUDIX family)
LILLNEILRQPGARKAGKTISREAVRAIILRGSSVLMVYSSRVGDYKFPGGGVEDGERYEDALIREVKEECGMTLLAVQAEFGQVIEYDIPIESDYDVFRMTSRYYLCTADETFGEQALDPYEQDLGFQPVWIDIQDAIRANTHLLQDSSHPPKWTKRDTYILEQVQQHISTLPRS